MGETLSSAVVYQGGIRSAVASTLFVFLVSCLGWFVFYIDLQMYFCSDRDLDIPMLMASISVVF